MSFELETESIRIYEPLKAANVKAVIDTDIIVPDTKPDVLNILQVNALSSISEKYIQKDSISVSGFIDYTVLYSGGDDTIEVKSIRYKAPFTQQIDAVGIEDDMFNYVLSNVSHIEFHIQNSRKINVKSVVSFDTGVIGRTVASAVSSVSSEYQMPVKKDNIRVLNMAVCSDNKFYISDELRFSGISGDIEELLKSDIKLSGREIKTMNNKVVAKGSVIVDTLYTIDGDIYHMENEIPFTEVLDVDGITPEMHSEIKYNLCTAEYELVNTDEESYISFSGTIEVLIKAYEENSYDVITDAYSPDYELEVSKKHFEIRRVDDTFANTFTVNEMLSLGESVPGIIKVYNLIVTPHIESTKASNGSGLVNGYLDTKLLYLSDSQNLPVYSATKKIPFSFNIDNNNLTENSIIEADVTLEHAGYVLKSEHDAEIRAAIKTSAKIISASSADIITDMNLDDEKPIQKVNQPGIVIYFADDNETLWDIAKRYNTTTQEIASVNGINEDEILNKRQQLLIPKRLVV